jgi:hypothetical protein
MIKMIKKEHRAVLEIIKFDNKKLKKNINNILKDKILNWLEILGYLCYHKIAGLAYETIVKAVDNVKKLDFSVFLTLYITHEAQTIRLNEQRKYIKIISSALRKAGIKHVFLKGAVLSNTIFPPGARFLSDIDILVHKNSLSKAKRVLSKLGFIQGIYDHKNNIIKKFSKEKVKEFEKNKNETAPLVKMINKPFIKTINVDINFSLDWRPNSSKEAVNYFLNNRKIIYIDNNFPIYSLKEEHMFIHLCNNFYKDAVLFDIVTKKKGLELCKFADLYAFIQKFFKKIDIKKIFNDSITYGFDKYVFFTLTYLIKAFPDLLEIKKIKTLYEKYSHMKDDIMYIIFDQYDPKFKMKDKKDLIERLFSYDIIKNFKIYKS